MTTNCASWKTSNGRISATCHPIHFTFGSIVVLVPSRGVFGVGGSNGSNGASATSVWTRISNSLPIRCEEACKTFLVFILVVSKML